MDVNQSGNTYVWNGVDGDLEDVLALHRGGTTVLCKLCRKPLIFALNAETMARHHVHRGIYCPGMRHIAITIDGSEGHWQWRERLMKRMDEKAEKKAEEDAHQVGPALTRHLESGDRVALRRDWPELKLRAGDVGVVEYEYGDSVYETSFTNTDGVQRRLALGNDGLSEAE